MYLNWKFCNWNASNLLKWWKRYIGLFTFSLSISEVFWSLFFSKKCTSQHSVAQTIVRKKWTQTCQSVLSNFRGKGWENDKNETKGQSSTLLFFLNKNIFLWIEWQKYHENEIVVRSFSWLFLCRYMRLGDNNKKYLSRSTMASLSKEEEKTFDFSS